MTRKWAICFSLSYRRKNDLMLGIEDIASYVPETKETNYELKEKFEIDDDFIENKIGVKYRAVKVPSSKASDMCVKAYLKLMEKHPLNAEEIECCIVVSQNPDVNIPHVSAIVHGELGLPESCAAFDISLGCSGFVYGLSSIISFMKCNGMKKGLLFTSDQYSDIVDEDDKNTALLFGDAATVSLISDEAVFVPVDFSFGTKGKDNENLRCEDGRLFMNGRAVFNFTATTIPRHVNALLEKNGLTDANIEKYFFHQGSKYIVDTITKRLKVDKNKVPFDIAEYGNTVSSSIPVVMEKEMNDMPKGMVVLSGFGVGLSWGSAIFEKIR